MALPALMLSVGFVYLDAEVGGGWRDHLAWYQSKRPAGAREVLSAIAGSSITTAGVMLSITIIAIPFAAGHREHE